MQAIPTRDQKAITVAKILVHDWFFTFGIPWLHRDQGRNFESKVIQELGTLYECMESRKRVQHLTTLKEMHSANASIARCMAYYYEPYLQVGNVGGLIIFQSWYMLTMPQPMQA